MQVSLSIVIPTVARDTLQRAIDSVDNQTVKTELIVELDRKREGQSVLRNRMIEECDTEWVGFCDDDDYLDPHYHAWLNGVAHDNDVVIFQMKRPDGLVLPDHTDTERLAYNWVGISFALRTEIARQFPFHHMLAEDFDLIQRLLAAKLRVRVDPRVAYFVGSTE